MAFSRSRLTALQRDFLLEFGRSTPGFFVTGGAVLAGFLLGHRTTDDLDLFTTDPEVMSESDRSVRATAARLGASVEPLATSPEHRRYLVARDDQSVRVDVVLDRAPQFATKVAIEGVLCDSREEIFVNKLCTLVSRSEIRDLVDLFWLERDGLRVEDFLEEATKKDGGFSAATAAWLLGRLRVPRERVPEGTDAAELESFRSDLEVRLRAAAYARSTTE